MLILDLIKINSNDVFQFLVGHPPLVPYKTSSLNLHNCIFAAFPNAHYNNLEANFFFLKKRKVFRVSEKIHNLQPTAWDTSKSHIISFDTDTIFALT